MHKPAASKGKPMRPYVKATRAFSSLFENTPVSIWEEDFSQVKLHLDSLMENAETTDLAGYINENPQVVEECLGLVRIIDVNQASLKLFGAQNKDELLHGLKATFKADTIESFKQELIAISKGIRQMEMDVAVTTLDGSAPRCDAQLGGCPGA
jgi:PAS domain-containing protein